MSTLQHTGGADLRARDDDQHELLVSVVIPCLNEAENIEACVTRRSQALEESGIPGEVVVADNASEDGSAELAERRRRARRPRAAPRLRQRLPRRLRAPPAAATS